MGHTTTIDQAGVCHLEADKELLEQDPIRALKKGSLVKLDPKELAELYWRRVGMTIGAYVIPYAKTFSPTNPNNDIHDEIRNWMLYGKNGLNLEKVTFLILSDLDSNTNLIHGWMSAKFKDKEEPDMMVGWFQYDMLIRCIDFSGEDDS